MICGTTTDDTEKLLEEYDNEMNQFISGFH